MIRIVAQHAIEKAQAAFFQSSNWNPVFSDSDKSGAMVRSESIVNNVKKKTLHMAFATKRARCCHLDRASGIMNER